MNPILISAVALALMMLGIVLGALIQQRLPERHLSSDSKEVVKLSLGIMGTLAALVLGLLVASAQSSYAARETEIKQLTADVILLDHLLDQYGKDAESGGTTLRRDTRTQAAPFKVASEGEAFYRQIQGLRLMRNATSRPDCCR